ncbi:hypothetical protein AAMO2058_001008900 [Amorphochlora amoebiformis]|uniref:60S acidic ribosomal protein P1 n=1 Tax=Amorphochlora amoebiformis TaxID=1561963 RepID=A0A7S0DIK2_9EUKA|mmetsp:Transcript_29734/g.47506  ORF Transcript_29734/g.47506 Transcript_29734/m.47506 type:complete len:117 (+) Transcript_29734:54-404(+)
MPLSFTPMQKQELATSYACMILGDCDLKINDENIKKILDAAQIKVEPYLPKLFSQLLIGKDMMEMFASCGGAPAAGGGGAGGAAAGGEGEESKEEKKKEEEEDDGGFDFDDDDDDE